MPVHADGRTTFFDPKHGGLETDVTTGEVQCECCERWVAPTNIHWHRPDWLCTRCHDETVQVSKEAVHGG